MSNFASGEYKIRAAWGKFVSRPAVTHLSGHLLTSRFSVSGNHTRQFCLFRRAQTRRSILRRGAGGFSAAATRFWRERHSPPRTGSLSASITQTRGSASGHLEWLIRVRLHLDSRSTRTLLLVPPTFPLQVRSELMTSKVTFNYVNRRA